MLVHEMTFSNIRQSCRPDSPPEIPGSMIITDRSAAASPTPPVLLTAAGNAPGPLYIRLESGMALLVSTASCFCCPLLLHNRSPTAGFVPAGRADPVHPQACQGRGMAGMFVWCASTAHWLARLYGDSIWCATLATHTSSHAFSERPRL